MLYGGHFTLVTGHKPLLRIFGSRKGIPVYTANCLQRWNTTLLGYNFTMKYNRADKISPTDALSRLVTIQKVPEDSVVVAVSLEPEITSIFASTVKLYQSLLQWSVKLQLLISCYKKWCISILKAGQKYTQTKEFNPSFSVELHGQKLMNVFFSLIA